MDVLELWKNKEAHHSSLEESTMDATVQLGSSNMMFMSAVSKQGTKGRKEECSLTRSIANASCCDMNDKQTIIGTTDGSIFLFNNDNEEPVRTFKIGPSRINQVLFTTKGNKECFLIAYEKFVRLCGIENAELVHNFKGHTSTVTNIFLCSDSNLLASAGEDGTVIMWNTKSGAKGQLKMSGPVLSLVIHDPTSRSDSTSCEDYMIALSPAQLKIWNARDISSFREIENKNGAAFSCLYAVGSMIFIGHEDGTISLRMFDDLSSIVRVFDTNEKIPIRLISSSGEIIRACNAKNNVHQWDFTDDRNAPLISSNSKKGKKSPKIMNEVVECHESVAPSALSPPSIVPESTVTHWDNEQPNKQEKCQQSIARSGATDEIRNESSPLLNNDRRASINGTSINNNHEIHEYVKPQSVNNRTCSTCIIL